MITEIENLPDVSFIDNLTLDDVQALLVKSYEERHEQVTGEKISLKRADPATLTLYACSVVLYQALLYVDRAGKQDLIKYSYGEFLDNLAGNRRVTRQQATAARTTIRFTLSAVRDYAIGIPAGTRATNGDGVYFMTEEYAEAAAGAEFVDVDAICTEVGIKGNNFLKGQINVLVDPLPYIESIANITDTSGGTDLEDDTSLAERTYLAPSGYSTAGPQDAYTYWAKTYNTEIGSVRPVSIQAAGKATIYILMRDGKLPGDEVIEGLQEFLRNEEIRPMTDLVTVSAPTVKTYNLELTYYIGRSNKAQATAIQSRVTEAIAAYNRWQTTEIGRDINPSELIRRIREAGAKRPIITSPVYTAVGDTEVAQVGTVNVSYGGLEDD